MRATLVRASSGRRLALLVLDHGLLAVGAGVVGLEPLVDAGSVERVAAERQRPQLVPLGVFVLAEDAHGVVVARGSTAVHAFRERVDHTLRAGRCDISTARTKRGARVPTSHALAL